MTPVRDSTWLNRCAKNVHSQFGEDGILGAALETFQTRDRWCVEFGAWDGIHLSNTRNLIEKHEYSAVLIEASSRKVADLKKNCAGRPNLHLLNEYVGFDPENSLDTLLARTPIPADFDLLSIDIDGNDYHVWSAVKRYRPKLVVVEYNPTIPTPVHFVQPRDYRVSQGSSIGALVELAKSKDYELIATTRVNGIFVRSELFPLFGITDNSVSTLREDDSCVTYVFNGFDGTVFIRGNGRLEWHGVPYCERDLQLVPRYLRDFPGNYSLPKRVLARLNRELRGLRSRSR